MLPHLENHHDEDEQRPSLPSIRDLFGDQLSRPVKRPSPFSLNDLSSSLPTDSQALQKSPTLSAQGSLISSSTNSPRSAWSQSSSSRGNPQSSSGWPRSLSELEKDKPKRHSIQSCRITLPPIYPMSSPASPSRRASTPYLPSSLLGIPATDLLPRRSSDVSGRELAELEASLRRRHTISSSTSPRRYSQSASPTNVRFTPPVSYPAPSSHPSLRYTPEPLDYSVPSPPSTTSGDEAPAPVPGERRKLVAKYECQYCGKMFNRPSSLRIHHNTHTGEKPFTCSYPGCGRSFSVMSNMRRHARTHGDLPASQVLPADARDVEMTDVYLTPTSAQTIVPPTAIPLFRSRAGSFSHSQPPSRSASPQRHSALSSTSAGLENRASLQRRSSVSLSHVRSHPYARSRSRSSSRSSLSSFHSDV